MMTPDDAANGRARLQAVQARVRRLLQAHPWLGDEIKQAYEYYSLLRDTFDRQTRAANIRKRQLARELLESGKVIDPALDDGGASLVIKLRGVCPAKLATQLEQHRTGTPLPAALERQAAKAALEAMDHDDKLQADDATDEELDVLVGLTQRKLSTKTHVEFTWRIHVATPPWEEPADPSRLDVVPLIPVYAPTGDIKQDVQRHSRTRFAGGSDAGNPESSHLARFDAESFRYIALYRLGGLADTSDPDPAAFPPTVAEQMADTVEAWTATRAACVALPSADTSATRSAGQEAPTMSPSLDRLALTESEALVLKTMALFSPVQLVSAATIVAEMTDFQRLSPRTVFLSIKALIRLGLAERPGNSRSGARLLPAGRRMASSIAD